MDRRLAVLVTIVGLASAAYTTLAAEPGPPQTRAFTLEVVALACTQVPDGVCLAYNGAIPGPMLDVNLGDVLVIDLVNRIPETIAPLTASADLKARLSAAAVSFHIHGTSLSAAVDGVAAHEGTQMIESVAHPGQTFRYTMRAAFAGSWHYHDHVLGLDGDEGVERGLFGGLIVRNGAEPRPDAVLDLHMLDGGANGKRGLDVALPAGSDFEILVAGLQNVIWRVSLKDPANAALGTHEIAPGMSLRYRVDDAQPGIYRWSATGLGVKTGTVVVS